MDGNRVSLFLTIPSEKEDLIIKMSNLKNFWLASMRDEITHSHNPLKEKDEEIFHIPFQSQKSTSHSKSWTLMLLQIKKEFYHHKELPHG